MNPLSKKDQDNIAELNAIMGTIYRESEYDLEKSKDLIDAIENATAEYMDYINYWSRLNSVMENFDQSLEVFHPEKWFNMSKTGTTENELVDETVSNLYDVTDNMFELASDAEERCKDLWEFLLLGDNKEVQKYFVGDISMYNKEKLSKAIDAVIEDIFDVEYRNQVQKDTKSFANGVKKFLENEI